jgi:uncharacterized protein (DUF1697 family)
MNSLLQTPGSKLNTFFLFLRAINVGGHNAIRMKDLTVWMQQLGFTSVKTLLNSGNVIFKSNLFETTELENLVRQKILLESKLDIPCFIRSFEDITRINTILTNHENQKIENSTIFLTLLSGHPSPESIQKLQSFDTIPDSFIPYGSEIILQCLQSYHKTKLSNTLFEKSCKLKVTTRNISTIRELLSLAG